VTAPTVTANSVGLSWTASTDNVGVTGYDVLRAPGASGGTFAVVGSPTGTTFTDTGLAAATTFRYQVRAKDAAGNMSTASTAITVTTSNTGGDGTPPTTPTNVASTVTSSSVSLTWTASTDNVAVTGYDVLRAPGASGGTFAVVGSPTATSFTDSGLAASTTFRYQVRAKDAAGNLSTPSTAITVTTSAGGGTGGCSVTATLQTSWQTGYVYQPMRVTNSGTSSITGWTVVVTLPTGHALTGFWNATATISGQTVTFHGVSFNSNLAPGASGEFGYQASRPNGNTSLPGAPTCTAP
jgi:chitodextrinase